MTFLKKLQAGITPVTLVHFGLPLLAVSAGVAGGLIDERVALFAAPLFALAPIIVNLLGRRPRPPSQGLPCRDTDPTTRLFNARGFSTLGPAIVGNCRRHQHDVSLVVIRFEDLPEMRAAFGRHLYQAAMSKIANSLEKVVATKGMAARTGPTEFTLVFPELSARNTRSLLAKALGSPLHFEFSLDGIEIVLAPELAVDVISSKETVQQAHDRLRARLEAFTVSEHARLEAMTKKRERYTKS